MIEISLGHYLTLGAIIFSIGVLGVFLNRKNVIIILMSIELILLAVNINLVSFSVYLQLYCISILNNNYLHFCVILRPLQPRLQILP